VKYFGCLFFLFLTFTFFSCKKKSDKITTEPQAKLSFSQSKLTFDTVFSAVGSVTQRLWVYNDNKHAVRISSIVLAQLYNSSYKITIDGNEVVEVNDYEINGNDSMQILVKVFIDPKNLSLPYLVEDSIVFTTNGNIQDVDLMAYGQDAFFLTNTTVPCNTTWSNTKPYIISGLITVAPGCTLTIDKGTRVRFHKAAVLKVAGTLLVNGIKDSVVTFRHDNLSNAYADLPGQWGGILFETGSKNNLFSYAEIKNATNALTLHAEPDGDTIAEVKIENTSVINCSGNAITATATDFYAVNSLINNSAGYLFNATSGGNYYFDFCTMANYSFDFFRNTDAVRFSNQDSSLTNPLTAKFRNTILWGDKTDELDQNNDGSSGFTLSADYSILKSTLSVAGTNTLFNQDPLFDNEYSKKFTLQSTSPAVNSGSAFPSITTDLTGKTRDATPDRGCYEK
jgi:hypothetical protein